ncbi:DUF1877 family protein [Mycolicibacterium brumae]|uniref:DUF1877 family protein n=1 Tax=Mycolicibacterium brumae TaxID=85968 RepID=UPI000FFAC639|nr:DUF1877 family protein [Mycolicibacterium brumae]MCV7192025.1 DUF1877 family protein [Mycolicibacterium brumae]RWA20693.1 hypothetical protein MBRU_03275 [Mycolicibacterium brumae DSM 44177]UWW07791.1 YfbM family protein [Mycolicibacterium brumae]
MEGPATAVSDDPWGFAPGSLGVLDAGFEEEEEEYDFERDTLYLDKAWSLLERVTRPQFGESARPAHRMFDGHPTMTKRGDYVPFVRVLTPAEVSAAAADIAELSDAEVAERLGPEAPFGTTRSDDVEYALQYLRDARSFMADLAARGRGMTYTIG